MSKRAFHIILFVFLLISFMGCSQDKMIKERLIVFDDLRDRLSLEYMAERYGLVQEEPNIDPKMIVLHWTVFPTFEEAFEAFKNPTLPDYRPDIEGISGLNVSSHFMVDRDGTIFRLMPETTMARHVIGLNHCAIGIENVGGTDKNPLTEAQLESNIWLVKYLVDKYDIEYLIGHYEYTNFENHKYWLEKDAGYRTEKDDPGIDFMTKVRMATSDIKIKPVPEK